MQSNYSIDKNEVEKLIERNQLKYLQIIYKVGSLVWLVWILFDYWLAPTAWLHFLPIRIFASIITLSLFFISTKIHYTIQQRFLSSFTAFVVAYMFLVIPLEKFFIYFTGFAFVGLFFFTAFVMDKYEILFNNIIFILCILGIMLFRNLSFFELLNYGVYTLISIWILMSFVAYVNFQQKYKYYENILIIEKQNQEIAEKNKDILESITYAKRIQFSLLPNTQKMINSFKEFFVFYQPRDIVSGDFYWYKELNDKVFLAVADCTGHGVPGAFMSLINNNFLNHTLVEKKIYEPHQILEQVKLKLIDTLNSENDAKLKDGMDIALICYDKSKHTLYFSGANRPLWILNTQTQEIQELKGDKMAVGLDTFNQNKSFSIFEYQPQPNDIFYIFTDGITDQFGKEENKKFGAKQLKNLLIENAHLPLNEQKNKIEKAFHDWKKNKPQTDDVCIIGFKV